MGAISALIIWVYVREIRIAKPTAKVKISGNLKINPKFRVTFYTLLILGFASGFNFGYIQPLLVYFTEHEFNLSVVDTVFTISVAFFLSGILNIFGQLGSGQLSDRTRKKKTIILLSITFSQLFTILLPLAPTIMFLVTFFVIRSAFHSLLWPPLLALQEDLMPKHVRGKLTGLIETVSSFGLVLGPILCFIFYDLISPSTPFFLGAGIFLTSVAIFYLFAKEPNLEESEL